MSALPRADVPARRARLMLTALVLFALGLRLWQIDAKSIWWDESLSLYRAQQPLDVILSNQIALPGVVTTDQHPPLYFMLLRGVLLLGGESDFSLRFISALSATLLVILLYQMGVRLRNRRAGLLAALCGACSPFILWYAQEARMYTLVATLGLAAFYALWRTLTEFKWTWAIAFGVAAIAAIATQYLFALLVPCALALGAWLWPRRSDPLAPGAQAQAQRAAPQRYRVTFGVGIGVLLVALVAASIWVAQLLPTLATGREFIPLGSMFLDALNAFSLGLSVEGSQLWPLLLVFGGVYTLGLISLWRRPPLVRKRANAARWAALTLTAGYVGIPILGMWALSLAIPIYMGSRYVLVCSPAFYLGLGVGLEATGRRWRWPAWLLALILLAGMGLSTYRYFTAERYRTKEDFRTAAQTVAVCERVGDAVIVTAPENMAAFTHYYRGSAPVIPMPSVALTGGPDTAVVAKELAQLIAGYDRVWLVHCRTMFSDPQDLVTQWLDAHTLLLRREILPSYGSEVTLSAYLTRSPVVENPLPQEALGDYAAGLALQGYSARFQDASGTARELTDSQPLAGAAVPPGRVIAVRLLWGVHAPLEAYRSSLRLVDSDGTVWSQNDAEPYMYVPTTRWPVGATVRHETDVRVPPGTPPGQYTLQLWLYRADDGAVLPYREQQNGLEQPFITLGAVTVDAVSAPPISELWPPANAQRILGTVSFARTLQLQGHQLSPERIGAGGTVVLQLYWRALRSTTRDCELVINWQDASGRVWHSSTHSLTGTAYGTQQWLPGQVLRGNLRLTLPSDAPTGEQRLHLLVRDRADRDLLWLYRGPLWAFSHDLATAQLVIE